MLKEKQRYFVMIAMKNYYTIQFFFRKILIGLPLWFRSEALMKTKKQR